MVFLPAADRRIDYVMDSKCWGARCTTHVHAPMHLYTVIRMHILCKHLGGGGGGGMAIIDLFPAYFPLI